MIKMQIKRFIAYDVHTLWNSFLTNNGDIYHKIRITTLFKRRSDYEISLTKNKHQSGH